MSKVRVRPKHQITIPASIAREAGIRPDDLLDVRFSHGVVTLELSGRNVRKRSLMDYAGVARGTWGGNTREIETQLAADRASWER